MEVIFYRNESPKNKIVKTVTEVTTMSGTLRDRCDITRPTVIFSDDEVVNANYMYIPDFNRYYFIDSIESIRTGLWSVTARVDVLASYASTILSQSVILADTAATQKNTYIPNDAFVRTVKTKTDVIDFPSGLSGDGHFILITAGGVPTI